MSGSVNAAAPNKLFKGTDVFISASCAEFDVWGALKIGTAEPSHARVATATQCVRAILGVYLNGTLNQVAVRARSAQVPAAAADIAWFLCTSSHTTWRRARLRHRDGADHPTRFGRDAARSVRRQLACSLA